MSERALSVTYHPLTGLSIIYFLLSRMAGLPCIMLQETATEM